MQNARPRVYLVEDDDSMREAIGRLLDVAGFDSVAYASAESLLDDRQVERAVCLVSDYRLPEMSGLELLGALRALGVDVPLILITAHDTPGRAADAAAHGVAAYLVKPFSGTALLEAIRNAISPAAASPGSRH